MNFLRQLIGKKTGAQEERFEEIEKLVNNNEKLLAILQVLATGVFAIEPDGRVFFWSKGAETLTGISEISARGRFYQKVLELPEEEEKSPLVELIETRKTVKREYQTKTQNSHRRQDFGGQANLRTQNPIPLLLTFIPLLNPRGRLLGAVVEIKDISDEKRLEQMKLDFVSIVSHELRTPITNIKGHLDVVMKEAENLSSQHRKFLQRAYISNERQLETIEALLNISRIERGTVKIDIKPIRLEDVISGVVAEFEEQAQAKNLEIKFIYPHLTLPQIMADRDRTREVLINLVSNAIKYTRQGGITIRVTQKGKELITSVSDTGIGISPEVKPHLFQKFFRGERVLTEESPGTGLGLYIAKSFVELMGGRIWVESEENRGSTFSFSLPIIP
ncbi:MAG: PAS domain-containing protein [Candidatus Cloacimonetes bacterium]|nr:PAS domain-containing protein [Candidatus Cloacimonadota bacterium]